MPLAAGGGVDVFTRNLARRLQEKLNVPVIVENRAGGSMTIGAEHVVRAKPDGYTVLMGSTSLILLSAMAPGMLKFDMRKDLIPLTQSMISPQGLFISPNAPFATLPEMIKWAKANPGKLSVGISPGAVSGARLLLERLKAEGGFYAVPIPYTGGAPALQALLAGDLPAIITDLSIMLPQVAAGKAKILGVTTEQRLTGHPQLPTIGESANLPNFGLNSWVGYFLPIGTPPDIAATLSREIRAIVGQPEVRAEMLRMGVEPMNTGPDETARKMVLEMKFWEDFVKARKLKFE